MGYAKGKRHSPFLRSSALGVDAHPTLSRLTPRVQAAAGNMMDENEAMQDLANYVQAHAPSDPL